MRNSIYIAMAVAVLGMSATTWAQKPSAYPAKGQSAQQHATDDAQWLAWAKQDTAYTVKQIPSASGRGADSAISLPGGMQ